MYSNNSSAPLNGQYFNPSSQINDQQAPYFPNNHSGAGAPNLQGQSVQPLNYRGYSLSPVSYSGAPQMPVPQSPFSQAPAPSAQQRTVGFPPYGSAPQPGYVVSGYSTQTPACNFSKPHAMSPHGYGAAPAQLVQGGANPGISVPQLFNPSSGSTMIAPQLGGYGQPHVGAYSNVSAPQQYGGRHQMGGGAPASQQLVVNQYSYNAMQSAGLTQAGFTPEQCDGIERTLGGQLKGSLWLAPRLGVLKHYELDFIIDNSISMDQQDGMVHPETRRVMTRLEEAIYRLGHIADLLSHIPVKGIALRSLSDYQNPIRINTTASPYDISQQIKEFLGYLCYRCSRIDTTPLYPALCKSLQESSQSAVPRIVYILNDGEPNSGGDADDVCRLLQSPQYRSSEKNPVCLIACTNDDASVGWMNRADKIPRVHVVDDFRAEEKEVREHQGHNFPFNEGFYLMSTLLGPVDDLFDKADENHIYCHSQYQEIMGRQVSQQEYDFYRANAHSLQSRQTQAGIPTGGGGAYGWQY